MRACQIKLGLHKPKTRKARRAHPLRARRPRFGELVQTDGSPHDWFEGRGPRCTLIVFIDDATGRLTGLHFAPDETTRAYLVALKTRILAHVRPLALCSDRHGIFRVNAKESASGDGKTEFGRVTERLGIRSIHATTPQAKGRVERATRPCRTGWQDRLVREMRLLGISTLEQAQAFAPAVMAKLNARFEKPPREVEDAHRPWSGGEAGLDEAMARREQRTLSRALVQGPGPRPWSKALNFSSGGNVYCVRTDGPGVALRGAKVTLLHFMDGSLGVRYKDRVLATTLFKTRPRPGPLEDEKTIDLRMAAIVAAARTHAQPSSLQGRG